MFPSSSTTRAPDAAAAADSTGGSDGMRLLEAARVRCPGVIECTVVTAIVSAAAFARLEVIRRDVRQTTSPFTRRQHRASRRGCGRQSGLGHTRCCGPCQDSSGGVHSRNCDARQCYLRASRTSVQLDTAAETTTSATTATAVPPTTAPTASSSGDPPHAPRRALPAARKKGQCVEVSTRWTSSTIVVSC